MVELIAHGKRVGGGQLKEQLRILDDLQERVEDASFLPSHGEEGPLSRGRRPILGAF